MEPCLRHQRELGLWRAHPDTMILNSEYIPGSFGGKKKKRKQTLPLAWPHLRLSFFWPEAVAVEPGNFVSSAPGGLHSAGGDEDQGSPGWRPPHTHTHPGIPASLGQSSSVLLSESGSLRVWGDVVITWTSFHPGFLSYTETQQLGRYFLNIKLDSIPFPLQHLCPLLGVLFPGLVPGSLVLVLRTSQAPLQRSLPSPVQPTWCSSPTPAPPYHTTPPQKVSPVRTGNLSNWFNHGAWHKWILNNYLLNK